MPKFNEEPRPDDQPSDIDYEGINFFDEFIYKLPDSITYKPYNYEIQSNIYPKQYDVFDYGAKNLDKILPRFKHREEPYTPHNNKKNIDDASHFDSDDSINEHLLDFPLSLINTEYEKKIPQSMGGSLEIKPPKKETKSEKTGPTLEDIGGYEDAKNKVRKFLSAAQHPEKFREWGATLPKGLLLYGPPGTGKTMFAKAIATELEGYFESISPADINSMWFGESEERIKKLFEDARKRDGHTVIFIDEIESMLPKRDAQISGGVKDSIITMFLQYMDGKDSPDNVTIIGATNRLDAIDSAVLRPGRFDRKIEIGYPDPDARAAILDIHIAKKEKAAGRKLFALDEAGLDKLMKGADILTGAQIAEVVRRTCESKAYESLENGEAGLVTVDDLVENFASLIAESARYDS